MEFNLAAVHEAIAAAIPEHEIVVFRDRRLSCADLNERTRRLANHLLDRARLPAFTVIPLAASAWATSVPLRLRLAGLPADGLGRARDPVPRGVRTEAGTDPR